MIFQQIDFMFSLNSKYMWCISSFSDIDFFNLVLNDMQGGDESDYSWSSDDELEKEENSFDPSSALAAANGGAFAGTAEVSDISSSCSSIIMAS